MPLDKFTMETVDDLVSMQLKLWEVDVTNHLIKSPLQILKCIYRNQQKNYVENWIDILLESNKSRNKKLQVSDLHFINYKNLNSHEFTEISETEYSSNKNNPQSSLEKTNYTNLNELNSDLAQIQSLVSRKFVFIKRSVPELNALNNIMKTPLRIPWSLLSK